MGRINGWKRRIHFRNLDEAKEHLEGGRVKIGVWDHDTGGSVEHLYEPDADQPFLVRVRGIDREFDEEGRYEYRGEGGDANKAILRKHP